jgi:hypothetical protein
VTRLAGLIPATGFCSQFMTFKSTHAFTQNNQYWSSVNALRELKPFKRRVKCVRFQEHHFQHFYNVGKLTVFVERHLTRIGKIL